MWHSCNPRTETYQLPGICLWQRLLTDILLTKIWDTAKDTQGNCYLIRFQKQEKYLLFDMSGESDGKVLSITLVRFVVSISLFSHLNMTTSTWHLCNSKNISKLNFALTFSKNLVVEVFLICKQDNIMYMSYFTSVWHLCLLCEVCAALAFRGAPCVLTVQTDTGLPQPLQLLYKSTHSHS